MAIYFFYNASDPVPFRYLTPTRQVGPLPPPYESDMSPGDYLEFALEDLACETSRGLINSFSNAKRAFHLLIDNLLNQYGLFVHSRKARFPDKLKLIDAVGMIPIGIMRNLNVDRNLLEHEYTVPSKTRVTEGVDVTKLLLLAAEKLVENTPHEAVVGWRTPPLHLLMQLEPHAGELRFFRISGPRKKSHGISHISGPIRTFDGSDFNDGIKVSKKPWRIIPLDKAHTSEWQPIIKELVAVQRRRRTQTTIVDREHLTMTMSVTLPYSLPEGISWHQLLDAVFSKRRLAKAEDEPSAEKKADSLEPDEMKAEGKDH